MCVHCVEQRALSSRSTLTENSVSSSLTAVNLLIELGLQPNATLVEATVRKKES